MLRPELCLGWGKDVEPAPPRLPSFIVESWRVLDFIFFIVHFGKRVVCVPSNAQAARRASAGAWFRVMSASDVVGIVSPEEPPLPSIIQGVEDLPR